MDFEPHDPPPASLDGRVDLREQDSFTIDPDTAQDFDDAIAVRREGDGYRAWVHIADVSHFVPAGSPLDRGAAERAFSLYVPGRVAPMLPPELSNDLCSLRPREDRFCVTVELPFDVNLELGEPAFYRSVIRSRARLTYGQAERILRGDESAEPEIAEGAPSGRDGRARAAPPPVRPRRAPRDDSGGRVRLRRGRRRRPRLARVRAARAHARRGADDPRQRGSRRAAGGAAAGSALPSPRAARPAGRHAPAREACGTSRCRRRRRPTGSA